MPIKDTFKFKASNIILKHARLTKEGTNYNRKSKHTIGIRGFARMWTNRDTNINSGNNFHFLFLSQPVKPS
jgi:hypothetical protein